MDLSTFYEHFSSDCTAGVGNQTLTRDASPVTRCGRVYFRLSHGGENYALLFSNRSDGSFPREPVCTPDSPGGDWTILSLRVALTPALWEEPAVWHTVTFGGRPEKQVAAGDPVPFVCDPIPLNARGGEYLCYEITVRGACYPYHDEAALTVKVRDGDGWTPDKRIPLPLMIGSSRPVALRVGFIGDSITQGCGTEYDSYTHWAAKIAEELPEAISVWDLGIGYGRAADAAADRGWLERAKHCDVVHVAFGINDVSRGYTARQIADNLTVIVSALKAAGCRVILFTIPPYDMEGEKQGHWYAANDFIRRVLAGKTDGLFDFAAVLGQEPPFGHKAVWGGHPNAEGCAAVARAYLAEYRPWLCALLPDSAAR